MSETDAKLVSSTDIIQAMTKLGIQMDDTLKAQIGYLGNAVTSKVEWELIPPNPFDLFWGAIRARLTIELM